MLWLGETNGGISEQNQLIHHVNRVILINIKSQAHLVKVLAKRSPCWDNYCTHQYTNPLTSAVCRKK